MYSHQTFEGYAIVFFVRYAHLLFKISIDLVYLKKVQQHYLIYDICEFTQLYHHSKFPKFLEKCE